MTQSPPSHPSTLPCIISPATAKQPIPTPSMPNSVLSAAEGSRHAVTQSPVLSQTEESRHPVTPQNMRPLYPTTQRIPVNFLLDNPERRCVEYRMTNKGLPSPIPTQRHRHIPEAYPRAKSPLHAPAGLPAVRPVAEASPPGLYTPRTMQNPHNPTSKFPGEGNNALLQTRPSRKYRPSLAPSRHQTHGGWSMTLNHRSVPQNQTHREEK